MPGEPVATAPAPAGPGFFGKVPAVGDFIRRRLPNSFIEPWDAWVRSALDSARTELGESWLDIYLTSPIWRFVLSPGACGPDMVAGVMIPSVDSVGRCFPFVVAEVLPTRRIRIAAQSDAWFQRLEDAAMSALDERFEIERFDTAVRTLGSALADARIEAAANETPRPKALVAALPSGTEGNGPALPLVADQLSGHIDGPLSLWWSLAGSQLIAPTSMLMFLSPGRPAGALLFAGQGLREEEHTIEAATGEAS